eukprot:g82093.t1
MRANAFRLCEVALRAAFQSRAKCLKPSWPQKAHNFCHPTWFLFLLLETMLRFLLRFLQVSSLLGYAASGKIASAGKSGKEGSDSKGKGDSDSKGKGDSDSGCSCEGFMNFVFDEEPLTWNQHYMKAVAAAANIFNTSKNYGDGVIAIHAAWTAGVRIRAKGQADPWKWSDGQPYGSYTNWNYNEPSEGRYCAKENICYENRIVMHVLKQNIDIEGPNGPETIRLMPGDWHDNPSSMFFGGIYKCCYEYSCTASFVEMKRSMMHYHSRVSKPSVKANIA